MMKYLTFSLLSLLLYAGCKTYQQIVNPVISSSGKTLHLDTLTANLESELSRNFVKYGFVVQYGFYSKSKAAGLKRTNADPPRLDFTVKDRFNPASVTKVITATGVLQLLDRHKYSLDTSIAAFLPSTWIIHQSVRRISFRNLLGHRSGINDAAVTANGYSGLKQYVQTGVDTSEIGRTWRYSNSAFDLCRILIAYLDGYRDSAGSNIDTDTYSRFVQYMQVNIYSPLNIQNVRYEPASQNQTLFYLFPTGSANGTDFRNHPANPGAAGVQLSVEELSVFLFNLINSNLLLSEPQKQLMLGGDLGWDNSQQWFATAPTATRVHSKGGYLPMDTAQGLQAFIQYYENGLLLTVLYNGRESLGNAVNTAYSNSWK